LSSISDPIQLGVAGVGRAFALTAPAIDAHPGVQLVAAAAPRESSRAAYTAAFGGRTYADVPELVNDEEVEAVYITTPHQMHLDHALSAISAGKHVLVEKPITVTVEDASRMISAAEQADVSLIVGPSHSFDAPVALAEELIREDTIGRVRMIHALYANDYLYRPRRAEELDTRHGGGVVFGQGIHQVDVVRRLAGVPARKVIARTGGAWDPTRPTEGAYAMLIDFAEGIFASLTYSGHAHFDGDRLMDNISELGDRKTANHLSARAAFDTEEDEMAAKAARGFTSLADCPTALTHEHFGQVLVFGDTGDLRLTADGVEISGNGTRTFRTAPFRTNRAEVFDALYAAVREDRRPMQDGRWGRATLEICHASLASAESGKPQSLHLQQEKT